MIHDPPGDTLDNLHDAAGDGGGSARLPLRPDLAGGYDEVMLSPIAVAALFGVALASAFAVGWLAYVFWK